LWYSILWHESIAAFPRRFSFTGPCFPVTMKPLPLLFAVSLLANAALAFVLVSKRSEPSAATTTTPAAKSTSASVSNDAGAHAAAAEALVAAAKSGNAVGVRDQLRALGFSEDIVRATLRAIVGKRMMDLQREIMNGQNANGAAYWRTSPAGYNFNALTKEQRTQLRETNRAMTKELDELVGPDPLDPSAGRFSFLPSEKASKVRDLERDYNDLRSQVMSDVEGFRLPSDEEKIAYLEKEQRKDLTAMLSPEELQAYDLRNSNTANRLRFQLRDFNASEDEYKTIYAAQKAFDDKFANRGAEQMITGQMGSSASGSARDQAQVRNDAQQQMLAELKTSLGEERFNAYMRSQNPEYRNLEAAAKRFNLPQTTVDQVFSTRDQTVASAQRIANDPTLNADQRHQALASLADQTRAQVRTTLGGDVADAYLKNSMRWLDGLQRGQPITVTPDGNVYSRPVPPPASSANPAAPGPVSPPRG
jgi:hypothetical protein